VAISLQGTHVKGGNACATQVHAADAAKASAALAAAERAAADGAERERKLAALLEVRERQVRVCVPWRAYTAG
jgi:hypothetical protein